MIQYSLKAAAILLFQNCAPDIVIITDKAYQQKIASIVEAEGCSPDFTEWGIPPAAKSDEIFGEIDKMLAGVTTYQEVLEAVVVW